jgi:alpha-1,2-mannosyltransferase
VSAAVCCALAARSQAHFVDLHVYRMGGAAVLHGDRLYQLRFVWLPFTYPPFAAVAFAALAVVPWKVAVTVLTGASVVALPVALYLVLRLPGPAREQTRERAWTLALARASPGHTRLRPGGHPADRGGAVRPEPAGHRAA